MTDEITFHRAFEAFLRDRHGAPVSVALDTHLWAEGLLDSFGLLETIAFLEDLTGKRIELTADDLPNFFTVGAMYRAFVDPAGAPAPTGPQP